MLFFHAAFYSSTVKLEQDAFLLKYCHGTSVSNHKNKERKKNVTIKYSVRKHKSGKMIPVCQKTFMAILNIKKDRIQGVVKRNLASNGQCVKEGRGGDRCSMKFDTRRQSVMNFIKTLKGSEPHYCRSKTHCRIYLSSELNIKKLWRIYNKNTSLELQVKQKFFRDIFNRKFNLSFGSPMTDKCSTCSQLQEDIKRSTDAREKNALITTARLHRLKYKAFYEILRGDDPNVLTMSFDCQKNLSLPKLPDQAAYFSRQWSMYHFCIVMGNSKTLLTPENVFSYVWNETVLQKGSNEISSAVYHRLNNSNFDPHIKTVRLIADGCGGQNKNTSIMCMILKWFSSAPANITRVEIIFPVVGHSFIPPDRVFARIEKVIRKHEVISNPQEYIEILRDHGTVFNLGDEIPVLDWRKEATSNLKSPGNWHFKFNQTKRFIFIKTGSKIKLGGEISYKSDTSKYASVMKKKACITNINPDLVATERRCLKSEKIRDVNNLLTKHYGLNWRENEQLTFYKKIEARQHAEDVQEDCDLPLCEERENEVTCCV